MGGNTADPRSCLVLRAAAVSDFRFSNEIFIYAATERAGATTIAARARLHWLRTILNIRGFASPHKCDCADV